MKKRIYEGLILLYSIVKWFVLATIIGIIVGISTSIFLKLLNLSIKFTDNFYYTFIFLPLIFFITIIITKYISPESEGHGTEKVIEAVHTKNGKINTMVVPVKLFTTIITLATGGSAGKEGPCAQIGAGLSSTFADIFKFKDIDRKKLVICGISAGFASVFGTPIAGAIFGVEVLVVGSILYEVLLPSFISGMVAFQVASFLGIEYSYFPVHISLPFNQVIFFDMLLAGLFFGLVSFVFIEILNLFKNLSKKLHFWQPLKGIIGGVLLIVLTLIFSKDYLGLGLQTIDNSLNGYDVIWYAFILKIIFTSITLNFGGSGGIATPIFFIGSTAGIFFANIFHLNRAIYAPIGMVSLLAGAANTPIAASIMAIELFGGELGPYAAIACIISFLMTGHRSVFPSQMIGVKKSSLIDFQLGNRMDNLALEHSLKEDKILNFIINLVRKINKK